MVSDGASSPREKSSTKSKKVKDRLHSAIGWPMTDVPAILMLYYITDTMQGTPKLAIFLAFSMYRKVGSVLILSFQHTCHDLIPILDQVLIPMAAMLLGELCVAIFKQNPSDSTSMTPFQTTVIAYLVLSFVSKWVPLLFRVKRS